MSLCRGFHFSGRTVLENRVITIFVKVVNIGVVGRVMNRRPGQCMYTDFLSYSLDPFKVKEDKGRVTGRVIWGNGEIGRSV